VCYVGGILSAMLVIGGQSCKKMVYCFKWISYINKRSSAYQTGLGAVCKIGLICCMCKGFNMPNL